MSHDNLFFTLLLLVITLLIGVWIGRRTRALEQPDIHVHLPEGAQHLPNAAPLENNPRTTLYWYVYKEASDRYADYPEDEARAAVEAVYGKLT